MMFEGRILRAYQQRTLDGVLTDSFIALTNIFRNIIQAFLCTELQQKSLEKLYQENIIFQTDKFSLFHKQPQKIFLNFKFFFYFNFCRANFFRHFIQLNLIVQNRMGNKHQKPVVEAQKPKQVKPKETVPAVKKVQAVAKPAPVLNKTQSIPEIKVQLKQQKKPQQPTISLQPNKITETIQKPKQQLQPQQSPAQVPISQSSEKQKSPETHLNPQKQSSQKEEWAYKQKQITDNKTEYKIIVKQNKYDWIIFGIRKSDSAALKVSQLWNEDAVFYNLGSGNTWSNGNKINNQQQVHKIKAGQLVSMTVDFDLHQIKWQIQQKDIATAQIPSQLAKNRRQWKAFISCLQQQSAEWQK